MTRMPVEAVWAWRFTEAPYKATYGRLPGTTYTKDYLQASGACASALDTALRRSPGQKVQFSFEWPRGRRDGYLFEAADYATNGRLEIRWETNNSPEPWRLFRSTSATALKTIVGNPNHRTAAAADREFARLTARNVDPWLLAVKLVGERNILHARAHLGNPPPSLSHASVKHLPARVRALLSAVPDRGGCASLLEDTRALAKRGGELLLFSSSKVHDAWSTVVADARAFKALIARESVTSSGGPRRRHSLFGAPYRRANLRIHSRAVTLFHRDPAKVERGLLGHNTTQEQLAKHIERVGLTPQSSRHHTCDFDIAWERAGTVYVAEVKSLIGQNESLQLRLGLGQVLHYAFQLRSTGWTVQPVLAVERRPRDPAWTRICNNSGVELVWPATIPRLFKRGSPRTVARPRTPISRRIPA
jgi:hypothetical protein